LFEFLLFLPTVCQFLSPIHGDIGIGAAVVWPKAAGSFQMVRVRHWYCIFAGGAIALACSLPSIGADCNVVATAADKDC
jgi:hypothetical protein